MSRLPLHDHLAAHPEPRPDALSPADPERARPRRSRNRRTLRPAAQTRATTEPVYRAIRRSAPWP